MPNLLATYMGLPKPLLHIICLTVVSLRMPEVSAITGDSWCGTLMCVKATLNDSVVTCEYAFHQLTMFDLVDYFAFRRVTIVESAGVDGSVSFQWFFCEWELD